MNGSRPACALTEAALEAASSLRLLAGARGTLRGGWTGQSDPGQGGRKGVK